MGTSGVVDANTVLRMTETLSLASAGFAQMISASLTLNPAVNGTTGIGMFMGASVADGNTRDMDTLFGIWTDVNHNGDGTIPQIFGLRVGAAITALSGASGAASNISGGRVTVTHAGPNVWGNVVGWQIDVARSGAGSATNATGLNINCVNSNASGNIGNLAGISLSGWSNSGTVNTNYGIYADTSIDIGTTRWFIYSLSTSNSLYSGPVQFADGTKTIPSITFSSETGIGFFRRATSVISMPVGTGGGRIALEFNVAQGSNSRGLRLASDAFVSWGDNVDISSEGARDVLLARDGAGILAQRNGANAQIFRIYNTYAAAGAQEWFEMNWQASAGFLIFRQQAAGGGTQRTTLFMGGATGTVEMIRLTTGVSMVINNYGTSTAASSGHTRVGGGGARNAVSGITYEMLFDANPNPSSSSTLSYTAVGWTPTINYAGGGAGKVRGIYLNPTNTALPTGTNGAITLAATASVLGGIQLYNTSDEDTNYERASIGWGIENSNIFEITVQKAGSGTARSMAIGTGTGNTSALAFRIGGVSKWTIQASPAHLFCNTDNSFDIGASGASRPRSLYWGTQALAPDGTVSNPGYSFASQTGTGFSYFATGYVLLSSQATQSMILGNDVFRMRSTVALGWSSSSSNVTSTPSDVVLARDGAGILALVNAGNAQTLRVYGVTAAADPTNGPKYTRLAHDGTNGLIDVTSGGGAGGLIVTRSGGSLGFFGTTPAVKQTSGANLTNNVTSGGTNDQIDDFTSLTVYSTDAAAIRNDIYQLARKMKQINDGLRTYGIFT